MIRYEPGIHCAVAEHYALQGRTDADIAGIMGITERTIERWKRRYPEFKSSLLNGKEPMNVRVVGSLARRAMGFAYDEVTRERVATKFENQGGVLVPVKWGMRATKKVRKVVAPDTLACIYWLNNRLPAEWKQRNHLVVSRERPYAEMSDSELRQIVAAGAGNGNGAGVN